MSNWDIKKVVKKVVDRLLDDKLTIIDISIIVIISVLLIGLLLSPIIFPNTNSGSSKIHIDIEPINEINRSEYFMVKANLKNIGPSTSFDIKTSIDFNGIEGMKLAEGDSINKTIGTLDKDQEVTVSWWLNSSSDGDKIVRINISSRNAGIESDIIVIKVKN